MAEKNLCLIDGCSNRAAARGRCKTHWTRWRKHGDPNAGAATRLPAACAVPGCEKRPHTKWKDGRALCNKHWLRLYNTGSEEIREKVFASWAVCSVQGCDKDARSAGSGLCEMHYGRLRRTGLLHIAQHESLPRTTSHGYITVSALGHPVSQRNGTAYLHRKVLFDAIGEREHACHWCGRPVEWMGKGDRKLVVDHIDGVKTNNVLTNLVASCHKCNATRGLFMSWVMKHKDDPFLWSLFKTVQGTVSAA